MQPEFSPAHGEAAAAADGGKAHEAAGIDNIAHGICSNGAGAESSGGAGGDDNNSSCGNIGGSGNVGSGGANVHGSDVHPVHEAPNDSISNLGGNITAGVDVSQNGLASDSLGGPPVQHEPVSTGKWKSGMPLSPLKEMPPFQEYYANQLAERAAEEAAKQAKRAADEAKWAAAKAAAKAARRAQRAARQAEGKGDGVGRKTGGGGHRAGKRASTAENQGGQQALGEQDSSAAQEAAVFLEEITGECMIVLLIQFGFNCLIVFNSLLLSHCLTTVSPNIANEASVALVFRTKSRYTL